VNAPPRPAWTADAAMLAITVIWGATFVTVKGALDDSDPFTFLTLRFAVGAASAALLARGQLADPAVWRRGLPLGVLMFLGYALQTAGLETTSASRSAFLTGLSVVFVPFASRVVARVPPRQSVDPVKLAAWASLALAALGLWQLSGVDLAAPWSTGDLLTLACALAYGFHIAATGRAAPGMHPLALVTVQLAVTALLSALARLAVPTHHTLTPRFLGAVALTGLVASTFAISVQVWAQARTAAVRAAVIYSLEPVFAVAWGLALGSPWPVAAELVGGAMLIAAVLVSELGAALAARA